VLNVIFGSAGGTVDMGRVLLDIAIILVVAKLASELSDRIGIPAVIGEIAAGILIGPSVLSLVGISDTLHVLAELGVIFLLIQVGLETDIAELKSVGRVSMFVAVLGVAAPMALGFGTGVLFDSSTNTSLFLGAALTATSIGITARVFGDLRALATVEARIVLGAAVADDVLGLVILTVVTRIVEQGSVGVGTIATTIALAVVFLVVSSTVGLAIFPAVFNRITALSKSSATVSVLAIGTALAFSVFADMSNLAPIIGAFVAGFSLRRIGAHERVERDVASISQVFIPIFFLNIGINTDLASMASPKVLGIAAVLSVAAIIGKMVSAAGALGTSTDKLVIGFGMLPRGEVGLIFASIGLATGALDKELYGALLFVVLATTLLAPPLLRWRMGRQAQLVEDDNTVTEEPLGGWLHVENEIIQLQGVPPVRSTVAIGLEVALLSVDARPGNQLLDWFALHRNATLSWRQDDTFALIRILQFGNARSWRFLDTVGIISRVLPEVAATMAARSADSTELDPTHALRYPTVEEICKVATQTSLKNDELILAAFAKDIIDAGANGVAAIRGLDLDLETVAAIEHLIEGSAMLRSLVHTDPFILSSRLTSQVANFLGSPVVAEQCRHLVHARNALTDAQHSALIQLIGGVQEVLAHPDLIDSNTNSPYESKISSAQALTSDAAVRSRLEHAPASYVLAHTPQQLLEHAQLVEPSPRNGQWRVAVQPGLKADEWHINIASRDRSGLLARLSGALSSLELNVINADIATWPDGAVLDIFTVRSMHQPNTKHVTDAVSDAMKRRKLVVGSAPYGLSATTDNSAHPWHSIIRVEGPDRKGLLRDITGVLAKSGVAIHHAKIVTENDLARNEFEVSDRHGRKLAAAALERIQHQLR